MNDVKVKYGDDAAGTASRLLAAARSLGEETSVVRTTSDNVFLVPEAVADEAGLSFEVEDEALTANESAADVVADQSDPDEGDDALEVPAGTLEERVAWVAEGEDESERTKRANALWGGEVDMGLDEDGKAELGKQLTAAVHGSTPATDADTKTENEAPKTEDKVEELPIGQALTKALQDAGLPTSGNKADKQARLSEHLNKE